MFNIYYAYFLLFVCQATLLSSHFVCIGFLISCLMDIIFLFLFAYKILMSDVLIDNSLID